LNKKYISIEKIKTEILDIYWTASKKAVTLEEKRRAYHGKDSGA
jgi:hypothetical protein